ncbi:MAG: type II toxin-antitoxin system HicA family toxin [Acidobacteriaceae bacterium]
MSKHEKALRRLLSKPRDYTWLELVALMTGFGFELKKGSGSGRKFQHPQYEVSHRLHEPHPSGVLKQYQVRQVIEFLIEEEYLP